MNLSRRLYIAGFSENYIETIKNNNLGFEINQTCISEFLDDKNREKLVEDIVKDIKLSNAENVVMHGPFTEVLPSAIDHKIKEMGLKRLNEAYFVLKMTAELSGKEINKMIVHSGWIPFIYFKSYHQEESIKFWKEFMKDKPENFELAIENVLDDEPYSLMNIVDKIDDKRVGLCLDLGHANLCGKDISAEEWVREMGPRIKHFHIHNNYKDSDSHSPLGEGNIEYNKVFELMNKCVGEDVTITIESHDALKSVEWLKENGYL